MQHIISSSENIIIYDAIFINDFILVLFFIKYNIYVPYVIISLPVGCDINVFCATISLPIKCDIYLCPKKVIVIM